MTTLFARLPDGSAIPSPVAPTPLGSHPSYDDLLDVALECTFPASDPLAANGCCEVVKREAAHQTRQPARRRNRKADKDKS